VFEVVNRIRTNAMYIKQTIIFFLVKSKTEP
jgi:hypothetical protein